MARRKLSDRAGPVFLFGVVLLGLWLVLDYGRYPINPIGLQIFWWAGVALVAGSIGLGWRKVLDFLWSYWMLCTFVVLFFLGQFVPAKYVPELGPEWIAEFLGRLVVTLVLDAVTVVVFLLTRERGSFRSERSAVATNEAFLVQLGLFLLVIVNALGSNWLPERLGNYDATETKVYSLGDRTRKLLADLPGTVSATYLQFGSTFRAMPGQEPLGTRGLDFLKQYDDASPKFVMKSFDAVREKSDAEEWLRGLGITDLDLGDQDTVIFSYQTPGEEKPNRKDVKVTPWSFMETSALGTKKFKGEQLYTSAIQDVIFPKKKVYFVKGHGEHPLHGGARDVSYSEAADIIERLALEADSVSIAEKGKVPDDCDLLVIAGPTQPLLAEEAEAVIRYLDGGGSMILMLDPEYQLLNRDGRRLKIGLEDYLAKMGIAPKTDYIIIDYDLAVTESGTGNILKTKNVLTADYAYHDIVSDLGRTGFHCRFIEASPIMVEKPEDDDGLSVEELIYVRRSPGMGLLSYGAKLFPGRDPSAEVPAADLVGKRLPIGVAAERKPKKGEEGPTTRVVVFGDSEFATSMGLSPQSRLYANGNATLFANSVSWAIHRESLISIEPKTLESETVELLDDEQMMSKVGPLFGLPGFALLFALVVWWRRRR